MSVPLQTPDRRCSLEQIFAGLQLVWEEANDLLKGGVLRAFELHGIQYQPMDAGWFENIGLGLVLWDGTFQRMTERWLRWCDRDRRVVLTGAERADYETTRANQAAARADQLKAFADQQEARADQMEALADRQEARANQLASQADKLAGNFRAMDVDSKSFKRGDVKPPECWGRVFGFSELAGIEPDCKDSRLPPISKNQTPDPGLPRFEFTNGKHSWKESVMRLIASLLLMFVVMPLAAAEPTVPNVWTRVAPPLVGQRWDVPLGVAGPSGPLLVLGGRTSSAEYKKLRPYDVLAWDAANNEWENQFPLGKNWGALKGLAQAPAWKDESFQFRDVEGNTRPNWTVYGTFSLGQKYDFDPDTKKFYFFAHGKTFAYDPADRTWTDLNPPTNPSGELGGVLLWSSICYDAHRQRFVLFGGGNIPTERGDLGTWTYSPKDNRWSQLKLDRQPPPRANSRLAYDPIAKKVVLFGGDQLAQLISDTWTFDVVADHWEECQPSVSPSPRGGHALLWLPRAKRLLLLGGYGYSSTTEYVASLYRSLPLEAWLFETGTSTWQLVQRWDAKESPRSPANFFLSAAVQSDATQDVVTLLADGTWQCALAAKGDDEGTREWGVPPKSSVRRTGSYDPAWYQQDVPPAEPDRVAATLSDLPANRWVLRPTPKRPGMNMDWGSAVFAPELDQIIRFSGGHSAYSGTAPQVYDVKTDRYSLPFAPELPLEFVYSNDQVRGEWSFGGNPWMTGHTYKSTGYDSRLRSFVFAPHEHTYFFDSPSGRWTCGPERNPYRADFYNVTLCSTPQGTVAWGDKREGGGAGLWRLDAKERVWRPLDLRGSLPAKSPDQHGMIFDAKRDRLLFFSDADKNRGDVTAYDFSSGEARWLDATGKSLAAVHSRETVYLPDADVVLIGARVLIDDKLHWLVYDCATNAWRAIELPGDDPIGKGTSGRSFNNSMGLMYDPNRKLVWAVGQYSHVHVLKLDRSASRELR